MSEMTGRPTSGSGLLSLLGESPSLTDESPENRVFRHPLVRHTLTGVLLVAAGAILVFTTAQGLVTVLVLVAACATATWTGRWAGAVLAATAGAIFLAAHILLGRTTGIGVLLTVVAVCMWVLLAWAVGVTADERRRMNDLLVHRALHDSLTGLPNRSLLVDHLEQALHRRKRHTAELAVIYLDLDGFKRINDTMGHAAGDALLSELGKRFVEQLRDCDTAARLGGDEFAFVCEDLHDEQEAIAIAQRLTATLAEPFRYQGQEVPIHASVGIAVSSSTAEDPEQLISRADAAMYRAKHSHGPHPRHAAPHGPLGLPMPRNPRSVRRDHAT